MGFIRVLKLYLGTSSVHAQIMDGDRGI